MLHWILMFGLVSGWVTASAQDEPSDEEHCMMYVLGQHEDGEFILSRRDCYETIQQAEAVIAKSVETLVQNDGSYTVSLGSVTLGRHFDGFNGTGSSISIVGSSCTGGYWNTSASWDNRISSSYNGCARLRHYDLPNKGGASQDTYGAGTTDNLSLLNNKVESVSYHSR